MLQEYKPHEHTRVIYSIKPRHSQVAPIISLPLKLGMIGMIALKDSKAPLLKGSNYFPLL